MQPNTHECPAKTSRLAIASLVCGILGFLCLPALVGVVLGIMALVKINKSGGKLKGKGLAIAGISIPFLMLLVAIPTAVVRFPKAPRTVCISNIKVIDLAMRIYAQDHNGIYPTNFQSMANELATPKVLWCTADKKHTPALDWSTFNPSKNLSYEYLKPGLAESNALNQVIIRCRVHDNVLTGDGSVQMLNYKR